MPGRPRPRRRVAAVIADAATADIYTLSLHDALPILGLSKPNSRAKIRAGVPYTAGTAAQNTCSCSQDSHRKIFAGQTQPRAPESNHVARSPTAAKPYNR